MTFFHQIVQFYNEMENILMNNIQVCHVHVTETDLLNATPHFVLAGQNHPVVSFTLLHDCVALMQISCLHLCHVEERKGV